MKKRSKRYKAINIDKSIEKKKDLKEIFELVKKNSTAINNITKTDLRKWKNIIYLKFLKLIV